MPQILQNHHLEICIDLPGENYQLSRFDWTGKIVSVRYQEHQFAGVERTDWAETNQGGRGFYNEFGIDAPVGYEETETGDWFHKIGVGLLKKEAGPYRFDHPYEVQAADFQVASQPDKIQITCQSPFYGGYAYVLIKEIELLSSGFRINYRLENTGDKTIITNEYCHNFLTLDGDLMGPDYVLQLPFVLRPERFGEHLNPEQKVELGQREIGFKATPEAQFFFSHLSGGEKVKAQWDLLNRKRKIGIREIGSFRTKKVNLWGWRHVISPELFIDISLPPGQVMNWARQYEVFETG